MRAIKVGIGVWVLVAAACVRAPLPVAEPLVEVAVPAGPGSAEPNFAVGADGKLYLSWIEPGTRTAHELRFATWQGAGWSEPLTIAASDDWFVNWADFPSMAALEDGTLAAHWLARSGEATYAYDVMLSVSTESQGWTAAQRAHDDGTQTEHGFVSLLPADADRFDVVWLDGRESAAEPPGPMTLRHATLDRQGRIDAGQVVDSRVCDCCSTDAVRLDDGTLVVAYRDRSEDEIRDIYVSRLTDGAWSAPRVVHEDGWKIPGCPVNGPAIAASGTTVVAAWFTVAAERRGTVRVAFSDDSGASFAAPVEVDAGNPVGRVDVELLADGTALVSWIEKTGDQAQVSLRSVAPSGRLGPTRVAATISAARASGFPRLARLDDTILLAWTEAGNPSRIHTAQQGTFRFLF